MKYNRLQIMEDYIRSHKSVTNKELLEHFDVSIQTLRRDLNYLDRKGVITKQYGGVLIKEDPSIKTGVEPLFSRIDSNADAKDKVARLAARYVQDNDVIFIDSGTTVYRILNYLGDVRNLTVITYCLDALNLLNKMPNITAVCPGGVLSVGAGVLLADTNLYNYNYNKAFISTVGVSLRRQLTNTSLQEGTLKHHMIKHASKVFVLADHSKFDVIAYNHFANFSEIDKLITDTKPSEEYISTFEGSQVEIVY